MANDTTRTKFVHLYAVAGRQLAIEFGRETRRRYENGDEVSIAAGERIVRRSVAANQPLPCGQRQVSTYDDVLAVLAACADSHAAEDEQREAAERARPAGPPNQSDQQSQNPAS